MPIFCLVCFFLKFNPGQQSSSSSDLTTELEDSRKFLLNTPATLLAIPAISGSKAVQPAVLTLLIYTISLRLAINTCFLDNYPTLSRLLHIIPLLGTFCIAGVELVTKVESPAFAVIGMLLGALPLVTIAIHHGRQCAEVSAAGLPHQTQHVPMSSMSGSAQGTTRVSH